MGTLEKIATKIIQEQELIIGPLAWYEAQKVEGLKVVNINNGEVSLSNGDPRIVVDRLVNQYERLFGKASHEACKDAAASLLADLQPSEVPSSLK